jgi:RimJ/RimL family protein N-acetyltransferase
METQPTLETQRLTLRAFTRADAPIVQRLAGDRAIADTTLNIPHPYGNGVAESWIASHDALRAQGSRVTFAVVRRSDDVLVGAITLTLHPERHRAELGYWIGRPYWGNGFATEAARAIVAYGFAALGLHRVHASHLARNPASGRVMQKIGMTREGTLRSHVRKWGVFEDIVIYGILREESDRLSASASATAAPA